MYYLFLFSSWGLQVIKAGIPNIFFIFAFSYKKNLELNSPWILMFDSHHHVKKTILKGEDSGLQAGQFCSMTSAPDH